MLQGATPTGRPRLGAVRCREDIQNLGKTLSGRIDETNSRLDETNSRLGETNSRLDETNSRLDETNSRIDETNARLDRVVEGQIRMATTLHERLGRVEAEIHGLCSRLDNVLIGPMGQSVRDHEERIGRISRQRMSSSHGSARHER